MRNNGLKRIAAILTLSATLLAAASAFAAEKIVLAGQFQKFEGFEQDNAVLAGELVLWQTDSIKKLPHKQNAMWQLLQDDSGRYYIDVENFGRAQVRPLKLIIQTRAQETTALERGRSVLVSAGGRWQFQTTVRGKTLRKGDQLLIAFDEVDRVHRMIPFEDTWQCAVTKE